MDLESFEGRQDFFLLSLAADRIARMTGEEGGKLNAISFNIILQLRCDGNPKIDEKVFLINLLDEGFITPNSLADDAPFILTKEGYEFVNKNGFTERERKRKIELKKDKDVWRKDFWFYPLLLVTAVSITISVILFIREVNKKEPVVQVQKHIINTPATFLKESQLLDSTKKTNVYPTQ